MALGDTYMTFHGLKIYIRVVEPEETLKRRVFVLSSPITAAFNWRKLTPELSQLGCLLVLMDLPGFGRSACGPGVPQDNYNRACLAWGVIDEIDRSLGGDGTWHLMGHGSACATLLEMANLYPDSVSSQVYISPLLNTEGGIRTGRVSREKWFDSNIADAAGYSRFLERMFARPADSYVADSMLSAFRRSGARESFLRMLAQKNRSEPFKGFAPMMALWGDQDPLMDKRNLETLNRLIPEAETHVLRSAGHMPMETHSHALRDFLRGWIKYVDMA